MVYNRKDAVSRFSRFRQIRPADVASTSTAAYTLYRKPHNGLLSREHNDNDYRILYGRDETAAGRMTRVAWIVAALAALYLGGKSCIGLFAR